MSFAKPFGTTKKKPGPPPVGATNSQVPGGKTTVSRNASNGPPPTTARRPLTSGVAATARKPIQLNATAKTTAKTTAAAKRAPQTVSKIGMRTTMKVPAVTSEQELAAVKTEALYHKYVQAEFMRTTAADNLQQIKDKMNKECTMLWVAQSTLQNELTELLIEIDREEFLAQYSEEKEREVEAWERLMETLPEASEKLELLSRALELSQSHLELEGGKEIQEGDFERIRDALDDNREAFEAIAKRLEVDNPSVNTAADTLTKIRHSLQDTVECYRSCQELMREWHERAIREASVQMGAEEPQITQISFVIPPEVEPPKLIDI